LCFFLIFWTSLAYNCKKINSIKNESRWVYEIYKIRNL
jgi:hypothetical protein